jgi:hypothetical protein
MSYPFNISVDASNPEIPIIKDANTYPLFDAIVTVASASNTLSGNLLTLTSYTLDTVLSKAKVLRINGGTYDNKVVGVKAIAQSGVDVVITLFDSQADDATDLVIVILQKLSNTDQRGVNRPDWSLISYLVSKPSAGDIVVDLVNTAPLTASQWSFAAEDGGWYLLDMYAIPRYSNTGKSYDALDVVFEIESTVAVFYVSIVDSNVDALSVTASWTVLTAETLEAALIAAIEAVSTNEIAVYKANLFIDQKLNELVDDIFVKIDCKCLDVCDFPDAMKLSIYQNQISSLLTRTNYSKAQLSYEKAIQLAQDSI